MTFYLLFDTFNPSYKLHLKIQKDYQITLKRTKEDEVVKYPLNEKRAFLKNT